MADIESTRNKAIELRKAKNYSESVIYYKQLWVDFSTNDKWDGWGYAFCLNKLKEYDEAYKVSKSVLSIEGDFEYITSQFSWASYMANIKGYNTDNPPDELIKHANEIMNVTKDARDDMFRIKTVLVIMDYFICKRYWDKAVDWSKNIDSADLSTNAFQGTSSDGKRFTKPSDKESYFLKLSKAHERKENYQICLELCDEALQSFPNTVWFKWHKGVSLGKMKQYDKAIDILEPISVIKKDWFILKDLSVNYYRNSDYDNAFKCFITACNVSIRIPTPENRWELYYLGSRILHKLNQTELANQHTALVYKLRSQSSWKIESYLEKEIQLNEINLDVSIDSLYRELCKYWKNEQSKLLPKLKGKVKTILGNGKSGFIKASDGKEYYFKFRNYIGNKANIVIGLDVDFSAQKSYDQVKKRTSEEAINIKNNN